MGPVTDRLTSAVLTCYPNFRKKLTISCSLRITVGSGKLKNRMLPATFYFIRRPADIDFRLCMIFLGIL